MGINKLKVAVVFEGRDAAGKGSAIKKIVEHLMTAHFRVVAIGTPTKKQIILGLILMKEHYLKVK